MKQFRDTPYYVDEDGRFFRNGTERKTYLSNKGYKVERYIRDTNEKSYRLLY
jgi:hypothetical protein